MENLIDKYLYKVFKECGEIEEVFIPSRNKRGKRYGFARFNNVKDMIILDFKLDNILFGKTKLVSSVPRFHRKWREEGKVAGSSSFKENIVKGKRLSFMEHAIRVE